MAHCLLLATRWVTLRPCEALGDPGVLVLSSGRVLTGSQPALMHDACVCALQWRPARMTTSTRRTRALPLRS